MLVQSQGAPTKVIGFTNAFAFTSTVVAQVSCEGMDRIKGVVAYSAGVATAPTLEFSMDGATWKGTTAIGADAAIAPANSGYTWDRPVLSWRFARITLTQGGVGVTAQACVELWPRE